MTRQVNWDVLSHSADTQSIASSFGWVIRKHCYQNPPTKMGNFPNLHYAMVVPDEDLEFNALVISKLAVLIHPKEFGQRGCKWGKKPRNMGAIPHSALTISHSVAHRAP